MRRGKEITQGSHSSCCLVLGWSTNPIRIVFNIIKLLLRKDFRQWLKSGRTTITLALPDTFGADRMYEIEHAASYVGLLTTKVVDAGRTEFHGVPTLTVLSIGPGDSDLIDSITGPNGRFPELKLY